MLSSSQMDNPAKPRIVLLLILLLNSGLLFSGERSQLNITFLNVKNGNAVFILTPSGSRILIDSGDGTESVAAFLKAQGVQRIDTAIISCPDGRNLGGYFELLKSNIDIGEFIAPEVDNATTDYESLMEAIMAKQDQMASSGNRQMQITDALNNKKHFEFQNIGPGTSLSWGPEIQAVVLGPYTKYRNTRSDLDNNSLVIKISYGTFSFLFTGNIAKEAAMDLTKLANKIQANVLQVPNNGSGVSLSDAFLQKVAPRYAICQPAVNTDPAPAVITLLKSLGSGVLLTKEHGAVLFSTDGLSLKVSSEK
jgi:competence protein ComEC